MSTIFLVNHLNRLRKTIDIGTNDLILALFGAVIDDKDFHTFQLIGIDKRLQTFWQEF